MMATRIQHPASATRMPAVARILTRYAEYDRESLEAFLSVAIDLLNLMDAGSDPDAPDFRPRSDGLSGNPDDAEPDNDAMGDFSWPEWHTEASQGSAALL